MKTRVDVRELPDAEAKRELSRRTRRSFLTGGVAAVAGIAGYEWLTNAAEQNGLAWPQRRVLDANGRLWRSTLSDRSLSPTFNASDVRPLKPNGDIGVKGPVKGDWSLAVATGSGSDLTLNLSDIQSLPNVDMITRFCCIEGWATVVHWTGARFSDFAHRYFPPGTPLPRYVSMSTPDEEYYVGLDMPSAMHPQTLLAYAQNGAPLTAEHGAPLRLVIPVKYGIKNIKRIGSIEFTNKRPGDYWAEEGYDWFAGL